MASSSKRSAISFAEGKDLLSWDLANYTGNTRDGREELLSPQEAQNRPQGTMSQEWLNNLQLLHVQKDRIHVLNMYQVT